MLSVASFKIPVRVFFLLKPVGESGLITPSLLLKSEQKELFLDNDGEGVLLLMWVSFRKLFFAILGLAVGVPLFLSSIRDGMVSILLCSFSIISAKVCPDLLKPSPKLRVSGFWGSKDVMSLASYKWSGFSLMRMYKGSWLSMVGLELEDTGGMLGEVGWRWDGDLLFECDLCLDWDEVDFPWPEIERVYSITSHVHKSFEKNSVTLFENSIEWHYIEVSR